MKPTTDVVKVYEASVVVCNWRYGKYNQLGPQGVNSFETIIKNGMLLKSYVGSKENTEEVFHDPRFENITTETGVVPIRITSVDSEKDLAADWCMYGSPISEIYNQCIPRWWPKEWLYNKGVLVDAVDIDLGTFGKERIIINCKVIEKPSSEIMNYSFADIFIDGVDNLDSSENVFKDDNNKTDGGAVSETIMEGNMFGKKNTSKDLEATEQINESVIDQPTAEEKVDETIDTKSETAIQEDKVMANNEEIKVEDTVEKKHGKCKKIPLWMKITGGILIIGSAGLGTWKIVTTVKANKDSAAEDKKTPAKKSE